MDFNQIAATITTQNQEIAELRAHLLAKDQAYAELLQKLDGVHVSTQPSKGKQQQKANSTSQPKASSSTTKKATLPTVKSTQKKPATQSTPVRKSSAATKATTSSATKKSTTPPKPSPKRNVNQMIMKLEAPPEFKPTKVSQNLDLWLVGLMLM